MAGFLESLIGTESGGNWQARNNVTGAGGMAGHFGRLQFGKARLQDAMRAGVIPQGMTPEQFMADPASQQKVEAWHFSDIDSQAQRMGLDRYIGQTVNGIPVTQDAIRAMAHLGGIGGAAKFLNTGGKYNPSDAYGTSLADYATKHGGAGGMAQVQGGGGLLTAAGGGAQDQLAPEPKKGLLGFLSNPDARARLAIALEGMTLNPNEAFMQSMQQGIQTRGETKAATEAKNKTAAWLRSQGREDLAAAVEGGIVSGSDAFAAMRPGEPVKGVEVNNNLVNPITGEVIYQGQSELAVPMTQEQRAMWGIPATDTRAYAMGKNGMPEAIGGGGTTINVGGGENEFDKKLAEGQATMFNTMAADSVNAQADLGQIDVIEGLMASGAGGTADAWKMWAQNNLGIQIAGGSVEALDAAINKLIPSQRPPGSGTMSDRDVQLFKDSLPKLINTPEGNQIIVGTMRGMAEYKRKQGEIAAAVINGVMDRKTAVAELQRIPDPLGVVKSYIKKGATPAASVGSAPAPTSPAKISSDAEYDALPSGAEFVGPDGIKRRKP